MIMTKMSYKILVSLLTLTLFGCGSPIYKFAPDEESASIKLLYGDQITMCRDDQLYSLKASDNSNIVKVPIGKRVSVGTYMSYSGYNVTYRCMPFLSFLPEENAKYISDSNVINNKCYIDLVKESPNSNTGVSFENSLSKRDCYVKDR